MTARCNREDLDPFGPFGDVVGLGALIAGVAILLNAYLPAMDGASKLLKAW